MPTQHFEKLKIDRKNSIIKAATREFATKDYSEVSVRDIAEKADISRGSFYLYFNDKEDCYLTVINAYTARLEQALLNIYIKATTIKDIVLDVFDYFTHLSSFEHSLFEKISNNLSSDVQDIILHTFAKFGDTINEHLEQKFHDRNIEITPEITEQLNLRREILFSLLLSSIVELSVRKITLDEARDTLSKKVDIVTNGLSDFLPI
ncbi:MAG: TetR/AcrR family transcriptional regulator [Clostridia bacterium]|nr:TetR/AcrR family transcriptional regulator [Clostridia bacterium]